jgi:TonB family protein
MNAATDSSTKQSDTLLWLAGAVVVGMGVIWLVLAQPWSGGMETSRAVAPPPAAVTAAPAPAAAPRRETQTAMGSSLDEDPLRMARLAHEAGMLVEPEDYSAWALYRKALQREPDNVEARQGLEAIAAELNRRANVALEQGRFDDVRATVERIRAAIPVHTGANDLAIRLNELAPRRPSQAAETESIPTEPADDVSAPEAVAERRDAPAPEPPPAARAAEPAADPMAAPHAAFMAALEQNRLLTPTNASAKHFVDVLSSIDPEHELTEDATSRLFAELVARADHALDTNDTDAASTWLDEAERLGDATEDVRSRLRGQLIAIESARRLPASALTIVSYTAPVYPIRALERQLNGWVDLEFTVARDGTTRDVVVTDASHNSYFRDEASRAVGAWRFEPHMFLDEAIEQRAYTRIRFEIQ